MSTYKSMALIQEMKSALSQRLPTMLQTDSLDASLNPCLLVGAAAPGATGFFVRIAPEATLALNSIGQAETVYVPHICQIAFEANPAGGGGADINTWAVMLPIVADAALRGFKVQVWIETNGTAPSVTTYNTANKLIATFNPATQYPLLIGQ